MSYYFSMPADPQKMPIDISFVFEDEKPAGKHGFLKTDGETMRFEDGTAARFWGVDVNGSCCFPTHAYAEDMARRIAQTGCNVVRLHQPDAEFGTPNIFAFSKGKRIENTRSFDPQSMDRMDYFIHCLKQEGIYIYVDLLVYRQFKSGDGVVDANLLGHGGKPWAMIDEHMIELQKEYATNMFEHYNPYTGLCYKDDPAIILVELYAECDLFSRLVIDYESHPYYNRQMREKFRDWLAENGREFDWEHCDLLRCTEEPLLAFKHELTAKYYDEMISHLRGMGVKIPITGSNWICSSYQFHKSHAPMDFMEAHPYVCDWSWDSNDYHFYERGITQGALPDHLKRMAFMHVAGKPLFLSEWGMPWPNAYRAESPIWYAAVLALQGWAGACHHTYAYNTKVSVHDALGLETSTGIGGSLSRRGIYTLWNDWAQFGLFYHSALILRRGDVRPADKKIALVPGDMNTASTNASSEALEICGLGVSLDGSLPAGYEKTMLDCDHMEFEDPRLRISCTGELRRSLPREVGIVDSPRTKAAYGVLKKLDHPKLKFDGMSIQSQTYFGVIAMSSLTDAPLTESDNILLSAIGKVRNTDQATEGSNLKEFGKAPIMAELIQATIKLRTPYGKDMKVWGVNAEGLYVSRMPTKYEDGILTFTIGDPKAPACYYLIFKE